MSLEKGFFMQSIDEIKERIDVETFCGQKILRVDRRRVGHAMSEEHVEAFIHFLATALPDLEQFFSTPKAT